MSAARRHPHWTRWVAIALAVLAVGAYIDLTPPGLLSKTDWVSAAVCHRIPSHSFFFAGRPLPLCARCTSALPGRADRAVRPGRPPSPPGRLFPAARDHNPAGQFHLPDGRRRSELLRGPDAGVPLFYEPRNELRLITGALNGLAMSALLWPMVNFSLWRNPLPEPAIRDGRDLGILLLLEAGVVALVAERLVRPPLPPGAGQCPGRTDPADADDDGPGGDYRRSGEPI